MAMVSRDGLESREGGEFFEVLGRGVDGDCLACNGDQGVGVYGG